MKAPKNATFDDQQKRDQHGRFLTGNIGGPGRPQGSRNKLSEEFLSAVHDDWSKHGGAVLARVRKMNPAAYLRMVAGLVPARLDVATVENDLENMTAAELREFIVNGIEELGISDAAGALRNNSDDTKLSSRRSPRRIPVAQR